MKTKILAVAALAFSLSAQAEDYKYSLLSCTDCFNFAAPQVAGAENITSPQVGLIVFDAIYGTFRGFTSTAGWSTLSHDSATRSSSLTTVPLTAADDYIAVNSGASVSAVNLPLASAAKGKVFTIKKTDSANTTVGILATSPDLIDGGSGKKITVKDETISVISTGTAWSVVNNYRPFIGAKACVGNYAFTVNANAQFVIPTKAFDTTNSYNTSTGVWTAPADGYVRLTGQVLIGNGTAASNVNVSMQARKNGAAYIIGGAEAGRMARGWISWSPGTYTGFGGSTVIQVTTGDTLQVNYEVYTASVPTNDVCITFEML